MIIFATHNKDKFIELKQSFINITGIQDGLNMLSEDCIMPEEPFYTFIDNALWKAHYVFNYYGGKFDIIADDSGLSVNVMNGMPGFLSKRWGGSALLLKQLSNINNRSAQLVCALAFVSHNEEIVIEYQTDGKIDIKQHGQYGFGYDDIFIPFGLNKTFGECQMREKEKYSPRYHALKILLQNIDI